MTCGMMLARLACMTRAYKARVGPLETRSMIPIRSFRLIVSPVWWRDASQTQSRFSTPHAVGVDRRRARRLDICSAVVEGATRSASANPGVLPSTMAPGYAASLACEAIVPAVSHRHPVQHGEAFGHQVGIRIQCGSHGGEDGRPPEHFLALDIPGDLWDVGLQLPGAGQRLMQQCRQVRTDFRGEIDLCGI